jgi:FlaA1/EpsC-like NDP-sugar epimerase
MAHLESSLDPLAEVLASAGSIGALPRLEPVYAEARSAVIFGCGHLGRLSLEGATAAGLNILAFADNNQANWGRRIAGIEVISPQEAVHKYNDDAFFVAAIYNGTAPRKQLAEMGCKRIVPYPRVGAVRSWGPIRHLERIKSREDWHDTITVLAVK